MNCNNAEKSILLKSSGELGPRKLLVLAEHLKTCASCRAFEHALLE